MINIPHNRAIQLLEVRLKEVNGLRTDLKALKNRLQIDVEAIFGRGSTQVISVISLDTLHFDKPEICRLALVIFPEFIKTNLFYKFRPVFQGAKTRLQELEL